VLLSFVFVRRDLVASRRLQHLVFGRRRLKLIVCRDERDREARRVGGRTCFRRSLLALFSARPADLRFFYEQLEIPALPDNLRQTCLAMRSRIEAGRPIAEIGEAR
jgi:hypothetical protein